MGNKATFIKKLSTGNLPATVASTAKVYDSAKDTKDWKASEGNRLAFLGYKLTAKMIAALPDGAEIPANFAVSVPSVGAMAIAAVARGEEMIDRLIQKHQDSVIAECAAKESKIDPTSLQELVADFFDTSRGGTTQAALKTWIDDVFEPTMIQRLIELNLTAESEGRAIKTDAQMNAFCKGHKSYLLAILPKDAIPDTAKVKSAQQTMNRYIELGLFSADDECVVWFLEKMRVLLKSDSEILESAF